MLPSGVRGRQMLRMLKVYSGPEHPHAAQFAAGTGARAKKRSEAPEVAVAKPAETASAAPAEPVTSEVVADATATGPLTGALTKYRREELDAEAQRLGIEIEPAWNKPDVIEAIQARYDADDNQAEE